jgi:hypothetical protein
MRILRIPGIKRVVIPTNLDDYSGDHPSSPLKLEEQPKGIGFLTDETPLLHYSCPVSRRCVSRNVARNCTYMREIHGTL